MAVAFGKYRLLRKLGTGGMGEVFLARAAGAAEGEKVVVKRILPHLLDNEDFLEMFLGEARTAARLNHPNISQIFELGDVDGSWYLTMEYVAGFDLRSVVATGKAKRRPLPVGAACRIIAEAAAGLDYAHKAKDAQGRPLGIVHRDVSPHNILVGFAGTVKLIDFGVAKAADRIPSTEPGQLRGKYPYLSPEQIDGQPLDHRSDQFSLGVVFWELLTGKRLFKGESDPVTLRLISECQVKAPSEVHRAVPEAISEVAMRALCRSPAERYPDAAALRLAIEEVAASSGQRATVTDLAATMRGLYPAGEGADESNPGGGDPLRTQTMPSLGGKAPRPRSRRRGLGTAVAAAPGEAETTVSVKVQQLLSDLSGRKSNLPRQTTSFIGRTCELEELAALLADGKRLISLVGPEGSGKTRLAVQAALTRAGRFALGGGVWFCDLSFATDAEGVCLSLARALDLTLAAGACGDDLVGQLARALAGRGEVLLVLDRFEHLLAGAGHTVGRWLTAAPGLRILVTSREPLRIGGEMLFPVMPLAAAEAVELFRDRASTVRPSFEASRADEKAIPELLSPLGGLPAGIELTAAWVAFHRPSELAAKLPRRFEGPLLAGVVDWSWRLLFPWEQTALAQASVFRGGFTLEAAEAVIDLSAFPEAPWALDAVQALRERALARTAEAAPGGAPADLRFSLDEGVRRHAAAKLKELGLEAEARRRHAEHYLTESAKWVEAAEGPDSAVGLDRLSLERENLLAVFRRALEATAGGRLAARAALQVVLALDPLHRARGAFGPHLVFLDAALARGEGAGVEPALLASALKARGVARQARRELAEAVEDFEAARQIAIARREVRLEGRLEQQLGSALRQLGQGGDALPRYERALELARASGDRRIEGRVLGQLGELAFESASLESARAYHQRALEVHREVGDRPFAGVALSNLGRVLQERGDRGGARAHFEQALSIHHQAGDHRWEGITLRLLGGMARDEGLFDDARALLTKAIASHREAGDPPGLVLAQANLGAALAGAGKLDDAEHAIGEAEAMLQTETDAALGAAVSLCRGHLELALARAEAARGHPDVARAAKGALMERLVRVAQLAEGSADLRAAARRLRVAIEAERPERGRPPRG